MASSILAVLVPVAIGLFSLEASAQNTQGYPNKVIRIVTHLPGGGLDVLARLIAQGITVPLGQPVIVDNRQTTLVGEIVAKSAPDGYTLLITGTAFYIPTLLETTAYHPIKDFAAISILTTEPNVLTVHPSVVATSVKELIALGKAKPGALNYTSQGVGTSGHLAAELFRSMAGVSIVHVPYKSAAQSVLDLVSGEVHIRFGSLGPVVPLAKQGKLRNLAVTSAKPSALLPGVPPIAATVPGYEFTSGAFMFAPVKTPDVIIKRVNQDVVRVIRQPEVIEKVLASGQEVVGSPPQELAAYLKADMARLAEVIKSAGIKAER